MRDSVVTVRPGDPAGGGESRFVDLDGLPASKSHVQRALFALALTAEREGDSAGATGRVLRRVVGLDDTVADQDIGVTLGVLRVLGADLVVDGDTIEVQRPAVIGPDRSSAPYVLDCRENGTCARMVGALVGVLGIEDVLLTGEPPLRRRPMDALEQLLSSLGVEVSRPSPLQDQEIASSLPLWIRASRSKLIRGEMDTVEVDGSVTTQVASGAMIGAALLRLPLRVAVRAPRAHAYLDVTRHVLEECLDVSIAATTDGRDRVYSVVPSGTCARAPTSWTAPVDASAAAFPSALAILQERAFHGPDDPTRADGHPDWLVLDLLESLAKAGDGESLEFSNLGASPDGFPALVSVAMARSGETVLRGAPSLRAKESDRIDAMACVARSVGCTVVEYDDGLSIRGYAGPPHCEVIALDVPADHRVVMASALLGASRSLFSARGGGVRLRCAGAVGKSWPGFWKWLDRFAILEGPGQ